MLKNQNGRYLGRAPMGNFRNPAKYLPLVREFYADHLQKVYYLKSSCNKDMTRIRLSSSK